MSRHQVSGWLRIICGLGLVGLLLWHAAGSDSLAQLRDHPPSVTRLAVAWGAVMLGNLIAFLRWRSVVAAAGIPMTIAEALRLGAIGFACNFVALGSVGGDVVKATLLAKPRPGRRAAAVTTVVVDRVLGLVGFLAYAGVAVLVLGTAFGEEATPLRLLSRSVLIVAGIAVGGLLAFFAPGRPLERIAGSLRNAPLLGAIAGRVADLAAVYRDGWRSLLAAQGLGLMMNGVFILSFYVAATSLPQPAPSLADHFFVVPLALCSGALPISPNGLGTIEATTEFLYRSIDPATAVGVGTLAALAHRGAMLAAGVAMACYFFAAGGRRSEVEAAASENTSMSDDGSGTAADGDDDALSRQIV
ncbi:hypothetical protein K2D_13360 [Planctomycetes bacterium K2D]|uniref:Flippase-like domain-containing protein n=1 Tax=Botrimarina mediterranea TaxID=2528022 RepID=A0A518K5U4_9BACT|nr:hypothetical protein Spa11_13540 [Botrimarina mediterranea]QDV77734.1 hypothetical protein K2D_13360 [Planctomycetes bacterium K2D]